MGSQLDSLVWKHGSIFTEIFGLLREIVSEVSGNSRKIEELNNQLKGIETKDKEHPTHMPIGMKLNMF